MAWSYTKGRGNSGGIDGGTQVYWDNAWTVTELTPTQAGFIRLQVELNTYDYWTYPNTYVAYCADTITCAGESVTIQARRTAGYAYTKEIQVPSSWATKTVTLNIALTTVTVTFEAKPNAPSDISVTGEYFGQPVTITIDPQFSGVVHTVEITCLGRTETLMTQGSDTQLTWTPYVPTYAALLTDAASATATITCTTYYGSESMGESTETITLRFRSEDVGPTVSTGWATAEPRNESPANQITVFVQGYSKARITFDSDKVTLRYGASASYSVTCNGVTASASPYDTPVLPGTSASIVCTVTDSRGFTASETLNVTLYAYTAPVITDVTVRRSKMDGTADEDGSYIAVQGTTVISSLGGQNAVPEHGFQVFVRQAGGSYDSGTDLASGTLETQGTYSPDTTYEVKLVLMDLVGNTAAVTRVLPSRVWAMKFRQTGNGVAFGKAAEIDNALELPYGWALVIRGPNGEQAALDYAKLTALLALI